jgi:DNA-binding HxlR family transcriptional regulator
MASEKMLAQHVGELVRDGFVERRENARDRWDVSYALTAFGRSVLPVMETLGAWGNAQGVVTRATAVLKTAE